MAKNMRGIIDSVVASTADIADSTFVLKSKVGELCQLFDDSMLCYSEIGDLSYLNSRSSVFSSKIGKYCSISWNVSIGPANHDYHRVSQHAMLCAPRFGMIEDASQRFYNQYDKETEIGNDVWIGCNAVIMRGVHVGDGAVIGANAIITKDVPPYAIMGGANFLLKMRFNDVIIQRLLQLKWWDYPIPAVRNCLQLIAKEPTMQTLDELEYSIKKQFYPLK